MIESILQLDREITLWLNQLNVPELNPFWLVLSDARVWFPAYGLVMAALIWKLGWKRGTVSIAALILMVAVSDQLSTMIKYSVQRLRPCHDLWMVEHGVRAVYGEAGGFFGFFSSHASNCFGFAICSLLCFRLNDESRRRYGTYAAIVFSWATMVALSRVMLAAHFVGDILVGTVFGLLVGALMALAARWIIVKAKL